VNEPTDALISKFIGIMTTCFGQPLTPDDGPKGCPKRGRNTSKFGNQCVCLFYLQGICYDSRSYDPKKNMQKHFIGTVYPEGGGSMHL
jgi:hypothetical protein